MTSEEMRQVLVQINESGGDMNTFVKKIFPELEIGSDAFKAKKSVLSVKLTNMRKALKEAAKKKGLNEAQINAGVAKLIPTFRSQRKELDLDLLIDQF